MSDSEHHDPNTNISEIADITDIKYIGVQKRPASHGWHWIKQAFRLFSKHRLAWILITIGLTLIIGIFSVFPYGFNNIGVVLWIVLDAGIIIACLESQSGRAIGISHLFRGFTLDNKSNLFLAGFAYLLAYAIALIPSVLILGIELSISLFLDEESAETLLATRPIMPLMVAVLVAMALSIPVCMSFWFVPALITFQKMTVWQAMKESWRGCIKNIIPLTVFGLAVILLFLLALIPLGLGLFIVGPVVMIAANYTAYRDIYTATQS